MFLWSLFSLQLAMGSRASTPIVLFVVAYLWYSSILIWHLHAVRPKGLGGLNMHLPTYFVLCAHRVMSHSPGPAECAGRLNNSSCADGLMKFMLVAPLPVR